MFLGLKHPLAWPRGYQPHAGEESLEGASTGPRTPGEVGRGVSSSSSAQLSREDVASGTALSNDQL